MILHIYLEYIRIYRKIETSSHEAAHALITYFYTKIKVKEISIIKKGNFLGYVEYYDSVLYHNWRHENIFKSIAGLIGQNLPLINENKSLKDELSVNNYKQLLNFKGCDVDFKDVYDRLNELNKLNISDKDTYILNQIIKLIDIYQTNSKLICLHEKLTKHLLKKKKLNSEEFITFVENNY
jgi:ATP-dependent Zn protease